MAEALLKRDNHYVPRVYLRQWAVDGLVATHSLLVPHERTRSWKRISPAAVAKRADLYTQVVRCGESDELERWLDQTFERPAEPVIRRVTADQRLSETDWRTLIRFALAQDVRTVAALKRFISRQQVEMPRLLNNVLSNAVAALERGVAPQRRSAATSSEGVPLRVKTSVEGDAATLQAEVVVGRRLWQWSMRQTLTSTISKVPMRGWSILRPAAGYQWPTSDDPLVRLNYTNSGEYSFDGGWDRLRGDVLMPVSPRHLLHKEGGARSRSYGMMLDARTTREVIKVIVEHADRYVFAVEEFDVGAIRARTVDKLGCEAERLAWQQWHAAQSAIEREF